MVILVCWNQFNEMALIFTFSMSFPTGFRTTGFDSSFSALDTAPRHVKTIRDFRSEARSTNPKSWFFEKSWKTRKEQ